MIENIDKNLNLITEIDRLKKELDVTIVAHYYQKDEIYNIADITGDSLELAKRTAETTSKFIIFCGVAFMGESVKVLNPEKRVLMPKMACCSMAQMINGEYFDRALKILENNGIQKSDIFPITYINSSAEIKGRVGEMGGTVCTSSNADRIVSHGLKSGKKILFVPDRCLGQNIANKMNLKSSVVSIFNLEEKTDIYKNSDIICYDGFCSVHQLFSIDDINFYRKKYKNIKIAVHPECDPEIVNSADFVGSTSQLIKYVNLLPLEIPVAVGTEYNLVNRMRKKNIYVLSATKPQCPTMNETTLLDLYRTLKSIESNEPFYEVQVDQKSSKWAQIALERMLKL